MDETRIKERGAAGVLIELSKGVITVKHTEGGAILAQWVANEGDWEKLWATIKQLQMLGEEV